MEENAADTAEASAAGGMVCRNIGKGTLCLNILPVRVDVWYDKNAGPPVEISAIGYSYYAESQEKRDNTIRTVSAGQRVFASFEQIDPVKVCLTPFIWAKEANTPNYPLKYQGTQNCP